MFSATKMSAVNIVSRRSKRTLRVALVDTERTEMNQQHARRIYFEQIKRSVSITDVLERYGILSELKRVGSQLKGCCPIHHGSNSRQFVVDLNKNLFHCFSPKCGRGGDVIT